MTKIWPGAVPTWPRNGYDMTGTGPGHAEAWSGVDHVKHDWDVAGTWQDQAWLSRDQDMAGHDKDIQAEHMTGTSPRHDQDMTAYDRGITETWHTTATPGHDPDMTAAWEHHGCETCRPVQPDWPGQLENHCHIMGTWPGHDGTFLGATFPLLIPFHFSIVCGRMFQTKMAENSERLSWTHWPIHWFHPLRNMIVIFWSS